MIHGSTYPFSLGFPLGGIDKSTGYDDQPGGTTPSCLNVWPFNGARVGPAAGSGPVSLLLVAVHRALRLNWCVASWDGGYAWRVTTSSGTYVTTNGQHGISESAPHLAAHSLLGVVYNNILYQASAGDQFVRTCDLSNNVQGILQVEQYDDGSGPKGAVPSLLRYCLRRFWAALS
jgi:hypothetical protein